MADSWTIAFGRYLRTLRERRGLSLDDVASLSQPFDSQDQDDPAVTRNPHECLAVQEGPALRCLWGFLRTTGTCPSDESRACMPAREPLLLQQQHEWR